MDERPARSRRFTFLVAMLLSAAPVWSQGSAGRPGAESPARNFDARVAENAGFERAPDATQLAAAAALRARIPDLAVAFDPTTGAARSLSNATGFLTDRQTVSDPLRLALDFVDSQLDLLGIDQSDLSDHELTDAVYSPLTGALHLYLRQVHLGLPVYNGQLQVHLGREGRVISVNNDFVPELRRAVNATRAARGAAAAVASAAEHLGIALAAPPAVLAGPEGARETTRIDPTGISLEPIEAALLWLPVRRGNVRLAWNFQVHTLDQQHV